MGRMRSGHRLIVAGLPLVFVAISWFAAAGFPYYLDNNETFLSYAHARNLEIWNPWSYAWMTAEATDPAQPASGHFYTHNPNAPRYLHYLLLRLGVRELSTQLLILSLLGTGLTVWLLTCLFAGPGLAVAALAVVLDYAGFLAWTVNTYRIWMFVFFFALVLAVRDRRPVLFGVVTFGLFQLDYGTAAFVAATTSIFACLSLRSAAWPLLVGAALGAGASVALFAAQVLAFYGWTGFVDELVATYARRGTAGAAGGVGRYLFQAWHGPALLLNMIGKDTHSPWVLVLTVWGVVSAAFALRRGGLSEAHAFLARLTVAVLLGSVAASTVLYGYFVDAFVVSVLPLAVFLIAPAAGVVATDLGRAVAGARRRRLLTPVPTLVALLPIVAASLVQARPPLAVDLFGRLQTEYRGRTIVAPNIGPWMANEVLAFTLTGGRAFRTSALEATPDDIERFASVRDADGALTYLCLDTLYLRKMAALGEPSLCEAPVAGLLRRGHRLEAAGAGWALVRLDSQDGPATVDVAASLRHGVEGGAGPSAEQAAEPAAR